MNTNKIQSNPRYPNFHHTIFHAGDEEQFEEHRHPTNGQVCIPEINMTLNLWQNALDLQFSNLYSNLEATAVLNTFRYIFYKFKKGIFVKIQNNKLDVFLPFSNAGFVNEWGDRIKIDQSKYTSINDFLEKISVSEGRKFNPKRVNTDTYEWYANNCILRYEYPMTEGDTNVESMKDMIEMLCENREVPDLEFFINRRDFPLLTKNKTEPYNNLWDGNDVPLVSHDYEKYSPICSMSVSDRYADVMIPTWDDWERIVSEDRAVKFDIEWSRKKPIAVFRGSSTGCGVTVNTNQRLKIAKLASVTQNDDDGLPLIDGGITKWNLRPRKLQGHAYLETMEKDDTLSVEKLSPYEQSEYKYVIHAAGHVAAFRLSLELSMGSVILLVYSQWKIWYSDMLKPYVHYVPIKEDLSDLVDKIKWCKQNDAECEQIAKNARYFFNTYLQKKGVLDYLQELIVSLRKETGVYLYNVENPLNMQLQEEKNNLSRWYPKTNKNAIYSCPPNMERSFALLQGVQFAIRKSKEGFRFRTNIFSNKFGKVDVFSFAGFDVAIKSVLADENKKKEYVHETYVATKCINYLSEQIPNFLYVFDLDDDYNLISEYVQGETLFDYIKSPKFQFKSFVFILLQIMLALKVAQNQFGFVHWDLTPWNIVLKQLPSERTYDYILGYDKVYRVKTSIVPVIIDFGKSHVVYEGIHHGFIRPYFASKIQDVVTILLTSVYAILNFQKLPGQDFTQLFNLVNFISGTKYRKDEFKTTKILRTFLKNARKYSTLIYSNKYELENLGPMDFVQYVYKKLSYKFQFGSVKKYQKSELQLGNGAQVFDFILSGTFREKEGTFVEVCARLKHATLPQPKVNLFKKFSQYALVTNLESVQMQMKAFTKNPKYDRIFTNTINFLNKLYDGDKEDNDLIIDDLTLPVLTVYDIESFLVPEKILTELEKHTNESDDDAIIESKILLTKYFIQTGTHIPDNLKDLLEIDDFDMKISRANLKTLREISKSLYTLDAKILEEKLELSSGNCNNAMKYLNVYRKM